MLAQVSLLVKPCEVLGVHRCIHNSPERAVRLVDTVRHRDIPSVGYATQVQFADEHFIIVMPLVNLEGLAVCQIGGLEFMATKHHVAAFIGYADELEEAGVERAALDHPAD